MIISRAPVRISFFGGGTDYPEYFLKEGGAVLATAIDKFSYVTASPFLSHLFDYSIRISYRKVEVVKEAGHIEHNVFRECLKLCGETRFLSSEACLVPAVRICFSRIYSKPDLLMTSPRAFKKSAVAFGSPRTLSQSRRTVTVSFHKGRILSRRPFPIT